MFICIYGTKYLNIYLYIYLYIYTYLNFVSFSKLENLSPLNPKILVNKSAVEKLHFEPPRVPMHVKVTSIFLLMPFFGE